MTDIFGNALSIAGSFMDSDLVNRFMMVIFAVILVFGVLNCILGYRLLRFWMMLCGFVIGAGIGFGAAYTGGVTEKYMYTFPIPLHDLDLENGLIQNPGYKEIQNK